MFKVKLSLFIFVFSFLSIFSQEGNINNYKYIIVPVQFEFQKSEDSFQINSLTKFLFKKYGFNVLMSTDQYPEDLARNKCLALTTRMNNNSGLMGRKVKFELVNCRNSVVFTSLEGASKEKEFKRAYQEAVRKSFESLRTVNYAYQPLVNSINSNNESIITEVEQKVKNKKVVPVIETIAKSTTVEKPKKVKKIKKVINYLTANPTSNGYDVIDNKNNLQYKLQETSVKNVFIVKGSNGIVFKSTNKWFMEYYKDDQFFKKELNIKF